MSEYVVEVQASLTGKSLEAIEQVEFDEATAVPDAESVCRSFPLTYGQALVHFSTTSTKVSDACVIGKCLAIRMRRNAEIFLMDDLYQIPGPPQLEGPGADKKAIGLCIQDQDYIGKIKELQAYLDKVKKIVRPGCSQEVLNVALGSMSSLVNILSRMSSTSKPHASL